MTIKAVEEIRRALPDRRNIVPSMPIYMKRDQEATNKAHQLLDELGELFVDSRYADPDYSPSFQDEYRRLWIDSRGLSA
jgi:hypothetical protein